MIKRRVTHRRFFLPTTAMLLAVMAAALLLPAAVLRAGALFDPARHMPITDVKAGMKGYGLTVMSGTAIERFEVEVISVFQNFDTNSHHAAILVRCQGLNLEHTGPIAGMSGSPIYLDDGSGHFRLAGAFAFGWTMMKDPVAGVQPIEYMLKLPTDPQPATTQPATGAAASARMPSNWNAGEALLQRRLSLEKALSQPTGDPSAALSSFGPSQLRPLVTPAMVFGLPASKIDLFGRMLGNGSTLNLQAGGGSADPTDPQYADLKLEPGSALAVPLVTGDIDLTAIGTVTEVIDDKVFGFGHPFNGEGPVTLTMGTASIHTVIANLVTSFKLGAMVQPVGTLLADELPGVAGKVGPSPATIPFELRVVYEDGSFDETYRCQVVSHPQFAPRLMASLTATLVLSQRELPEYHTIESEVTVEFAGGRTIVIPTKGAGWSVMPLYINVGSALSLAASNPFETVLPVSLKGEVRIINSINEAEITAVNVPRTEFRPGQTLKAFVTYRPYRGEETTMPVELELPRDLPDGSYMVSIADAATYYGEERMLTPFRFTADNIDEVFDVIQYATSIDESALYIRLVRQADGVAVGRTAMPSLPSSRQQVLLSSGRTNTTPFASSIVKQIPTELLMSGGVQVQITINRHARAESVAPGNSANQPATQAGDSTENNHQNRDHQ